jgi:hypothetical protein
MDKPVMGDLEREILHAIANHDGEWYWYQLDRAIISLKPELSMQLMPAIKTLERMGLITIRPNPAMDEIPRYWISETARSLTSPPKS